MDNIYMEYMVRREDRQVQIMKKAGMIAGALILNAAAFFLSPAAVTLVLAGSILCFYLFWPKIKREYEYTYTDGLIDIDVIYSARSRKRLLSADAREFRFLVPADNADKKAEIEAKYDKVIDAGSGTVNERTYIGVLKKNDRNIKLIFEPDDRMIAALRRYIPNKFVLRR